MVDPTPFLDPLIRWQVVPVFRETLLGPNGLRLEEWLQNGQARIVKHGTHRTVYQVVLPELSFYLKHYPVPDLRAWIRQLVRPSKARSEFGNALEIARRGVPTFSPLAFGEKQARFGPGASFLITRALENTLPLNIFLEETWSALPTQRRTPLGQRLATALARLLARMHDFGIWHYDLHAGNLLIRLDPDDHPELFLIDLWAVTLRPRLDWPTSRNNLIMLNRWFSLRASRSERLRFWHAYCQARTTAWPGLSQRYRGSAIGLRKLHLNLARHLEFRTVESNVDFWQRRDRRCLESNRSYRRVRSDSVVGHTVTDLDPAFLATLLADPDEPFRRPGVRLLKNSRSSTVAELEINQQGAPRRVIYKRFRVTTWSDPWVALVRPTPALRSWVLGQGFLERSLPTPRPLAVLHRVRAGLFQEGYLLAEKIENAVDLREFLQQLSVARGQWPLAGGHLVSGPDNCRRVMRETIRRVGEVIRELHHRRLSHRDLKAANILVTTRHSPLAPHHSPLTTHHSPIAVWFIDLVGVVRHRKLRHTRRAKNLARLHASFCTHPALTRTDKLRFLRAYLRWGLYGKEGWKKWWRWIDRATRAKVARNLKRGRPLL